MWLDQTFNGDLLSLGQADKMPDRYIALRKLIEPGAESVCWHLTNIQCRAVGGQLPLQWEGIYFRHVPVDVLSQVYEDFAHEFIPTLARNTSIHFTPRKIAEIVIDGAFSAVRSAAPDQAQVLDPSVGGGVFLVLAFKRLVAERWKATGRRPRRDEIRRILMEQLAGMDVNVDALNVTALSLYLCALELDPDPSPLSDLKFKKLIGSILHPVDVASLDPNLVPVNSPDDDLLGSLSHQILEGHANKYDIVVGNPPWSGFKEARADALNRTLRHLISTASPPPAPTGAAVVARYGSPDIAFLLAASLWARAHGALGFVVHGRFFFQGEAFGLRRHVFERLKVTGVMNFAALRQDAKLWPKNDAQFALLVAINEQPGPLDSFYFISPRHEPALSRVGAFRVDPSAAIPVPVHDICTEPQAFKALYKGGRLGLDLLRRMNGAAHVDEARESLRSEVSRRDDIRRGPRALALGRQVAKYGLEFKSGYQLGKPSERTHDASHLNGLLDVQLDSAYVAAPGARELEADAFFELPKVQWPRDPSIYRAPLLLLRESPKQDRRLRGALFAERDVAYRESFIGLSIHGRPEAAQLLDLIYIVSYSDLFLYYQLLTSPKFGVERDSSLQTDLMAFPLVDETQLSSSVWLSVRKMAERIRLGEVNWTALDVLVSELHSLTRADRQLVQDTLATELPFASVSKWTSQRTDVADRVRFVYQIRQLLLPFFPSALIDVRLLRATPIDGWCFLEITEPDSPSNDAEPTDLHELVGFADSYWVSRMTVKRGNRTVIGLLDQKRYWTLTEARALALDWLQSSDGEIASDVSERGEAPL